jgi:hypothetical protein
MRQHYSWVVDSGATSHCTGMKSHKWVRYRELAPGEHQVIFADESRVSAAGTGDIAMLLPPGDGTSTRVICILTLKAAGVSSYSPRPVPVGNEDIIHID